MNRTFHPFLLALAFTLICSSCSKDDGIGNNLDLPSTVTFTHLPMEFSEVDHFDPIGGIRSIPNDHGGLGLVNPYTLPASVPIYAMSDGVITNIRKDLRIIDNHAFVPAAVRGKDYDDFALRISVSKTAHLIYGHISALSDQLLNQAGTIRVSGENRVNIEVKSGDVLGFVGPHPAFDVGMYDEDNDNYFVNPARYNEEYLDAVSYTDYLTPALRQQLWTVNERTLAPRGGTVSHDVAGTLAGNWFAPGAGPYDWSKILIIARHHIYADKVTIADTSPFEDGNGSLNIGIDAVTYWIKGNTLVPEEVTPATGMVKLPAGPWWILHANPDAQAQGTLGIEMTSESTLRFEWFEHQAPDQVTVFTSAARDFER